MAEPLTGGAHHPLGVQDVVQGPITPVHARPFVVILHGVPLQHGQLASGCAVNVRNIFGSPFGAAESYAQRSSFPAPAVRKSPFRYDVSTVYAERGLIEGKSARAGVGLKPQAQPAKNRTTQAFKP
ncbi:MAG: hypothetical protein ABFD75_12795 [Smithella sp.]